MFLNSSLNSVSSSVNQIHKVLINYWHVASVFCLRACCWWRPMKSCWRCNEDGSVYLFYLTWFFSVNIQFNTLINIHLYNYRIGFSPLANADWSRETFTWFPFLHSVAAGNISFFFFLRWESNHSVTLVCMWLMWMCGSFRWSQITATQFGAHNEQTTEVFTEDDRSL